MEEKVIQITEHTLLKLLMRRGLDSDRQNIVLNEGELGYTTDTKKLYIGDGSTMGGIAVGGSKFLGVSSDITSLGPGSLLDLGYSTTTKQLYYISSGTGTDLSNWTPISNLIINTDGTININNSEISLGDVAGDGIAKDSSNKLEIDKSIKTDTISPKTAPYISLPDKIAFGNLVYNFPNYGFDNTYLKYTTGGNLSWSAIVGTGNSFVNSEVLPVGTIIPFPSTTLPSTGKYLTCDGSYVSSTDYPELYAILGETYGPYSGSDFKLPDLRGKVPIGYSTTPIDDINGTTLTFALATSGGAYSNTLVEVNIPEHTHMTVAIGDTSSSIQTYDYMSSRGSWGVGDNHNYELASTTGAPSYGETSSYGSATPTPINGIQPYLTINYIIKALPDDIAECSITLENGLTSRELVIGDTSTINPLSGKYMLGLQAKLTAADLGYIDVDQSGTINSYDTSVAGDNTATDHVHTFGFINFLTTPQAIADTSYTITDSGKTIQVYPSIIDVDGVDKGVGIAANAKNVLLEFDCPGGTNASLIYAALNDGFYDDANKRYKITNRGGAMQATVPLSSYDGKLTLYIKPSITITPTSSWTLKVIGWTL